MTVHPYSRIWTGKAAPPTVNDDTTLGYEVGDEWVDETNDKVYKALDVTDSVAVWLLITPSVQTTLYLDTTASLADNYTLSVSPSAYAETANAISVNGALTFFERFVSPPLGVTSIPAGVWEFNIYGATSSDVGSNLIKFRVNKRVAQTGMTGTWTGAGATRTFTVTGGTPFVPGDANASRLLAGLVETPNQTGWISAFTSSSVVTVTLTDPAYVNETGVELSAIYYYLFDATTTELSGSSAALYTVLSTQSAFSCTETDMLVIALFGLNDTATHTLTLYYGGSINFTHFHTTFPVTSNSLQFSPADYAELVAFANGGTSTHTAMDAGIVTNGNTHDHAGGDGAVLTFLFPFATYVTLNPMSAALSYPYGGTAEAAMSFIKWTQAIFTLGNHDNSNYYTIAIFYRANSSGSASDVTIATMDTKTATANNNGYTFSTTTFAASSIAASGYLYVKVDKTGTPNDMYILTPALRCKLT